MEKRFGDVIALRDVSFTVQEGEFFCILGPSGAGKTTTLRTIAGLESPDAGTVFIGGRDVHRVHPRDRDVALFFQEVALYPHLNGFDNIAFPLRRQRLPATDIRRRVGEISETFGIVHLLGRKPATYSGGERQRVALARALIRRPHVYLLDEPLSNLDAKLRLDMRAELKRLQRELGQTTIYVTPDQVEAMAMGDRLLVLRQGEPQQIGTPIEVYDHPANEFVASFIGSPPMNFLRCRLERRADGWWLQHAAFSICVSQLLDGGTEVIPGDIVLAIRPEDVSTTDRRPEAHAEARVYVSEHLGHRTLVDFDFAGDLLKVLASGFRRFEIGESQLLRFDLERAHLIDTATARVLV